MTLDRCDETDDGIGGPHGTMPWEAMAGEGEGPGIAAAMRPAAARMGVSAASTVPAGSSATDAADGAAHDDTLAALLIGAVGDGARLRDLQAIPDHVMNGIHVYAYDFYREGRLDEAEAFFRFLCLYDFYNTDYATGLAAVFQLQGRYRQAIDMYGVAMRLGFDDPSPVFYAGQCFIKLGMTEDAADCFAFVVAQAQDASLRERANAYLDSLAEGEPDLTKEGKAA